ncbi:MAG: ABC transporter permease [Cyclobacteriaceae bacterium]
MEERQVWTEVIQPKTKWFDLNLVELWEYRDLVLLFVRRDFVAVYKQTILGPLWHFIQPLFTTLIFTIIFGRVAKIPTDGIPPFLFYLTGITLWNFFSRCLNNTSNTFVSNAGIFGKVYFPRMVIPVSIVLSALLAFGIQVLLLLVVYFYYVFDGATQLRMEILLFPLFVIIMSLLGLSLGVILSSLTTKYRDLTFLMAFGVQLWMYASPIIYPMSVLDPELQRFAFFNPVAPVIEGFRFIFLGQGLLDWTMIMYSFSVAVGLFFIGLSIFHRVEKTFMDTV